MSERSPRSVAERRVLFAGIAIVVVGALILYAVRHSSFQVACVFITLGGLGYVLYRDLEAIQRKLPREEDPVQKLADTNRDLEQLLGPALDPRQAPPAVDDGGYFDRQYIVHKVLFTTLVCRSQ